MGKSAPPPPQWPSFTHLTECPAVSGFSDFPLCGTPPWRRWLEAQVNCWISLRLLQVTKGGKAKSELKTPELVTNHPVGDKKGLIIGCLSCQVICQCGTATAAEDSQMQGR